MNTVSPHTSLPVPVKDMCFWDQYEGQEDETHKAVRNSLGLSTESPLPPEENKLAAVENLLACLGEKHPGFELLNRPGYRSKYAQDMGLPPEEEVNPRRVCLYWEDDHTSARGVRTSDYVRDYRNRYRHGIEEVGDQDGRPLYIKVPNDMTYPILRELIADIQQAYPEHFKDNAKLESLLLDTHGEPGGILQDGDGIGGFDVFPKIGPQRPGFMAAPFYELTQNLRLDACRETAELDTCELEHVAELAAEHNCDIQLNTSISLSNWGHHPTTRRPVVVVEADLYDGYQTQGALSSVAQYGQQTVSDAGGNAVILHADGSVSRVARDSDLLSRWFRVDSRLNQPERLDFVSDFFEDRCGEIIDGTCEPHEIVTWPWDQLPPSDQPNPTP